MFTVIPLPRTFAHILPDIVLSTPTQTLVILSARVIGDGLFLFFFRDRRRCVGSAGSPVLRVKPPLARRAQIPPSSRAPPRSGPFTHTAAVRVRTNSRHYTGEGTRDSVSFVFFFFLQFRLPPLYDENFISSMGFYSLLVSARFQR